MEACEVSLRQQLCGYPHISSSNERELVVCTRDGIHVYNLETRRFQSRAHAYPYQLNTKGCWFFAVRHHVLIFDFVARKAVRYDALTYRYKVLPLTDEVMETVRTIGRTGRLYEDSKGQCIFLWSTRPIGRFDEFVWRNGDNLLSASHRQHVTLFGRRIAFRQDGCVSVSPVGEPDAVEEIGHGLVISGDAVMMQCFRHGESVTVAFTLQTSHSLRNLTNDSPEHDVEAPLLLRHRTTGVLQARVRRSQMPTFWGRDDTVIALHNTVYLLYTRETKSALRLVHVQTVSTKHMSIYERLATKQEVPGWLAHMLSRLSLRDQAPGDLPRNLKRRLDAAERSVQDAKRRITLANQAYERATRHHSRVTQEIIQHKQREQCQQDVIQHKQREQCQSV